MATAIKPLINTQNIISQTKPIKSDIARVNLVATGIKSSLFKRNKSTRESISRIKFFQSKRDQQVRRKEREDILESSGISGATKRMQTIAAQSTRGFLGRILDFIGTMLVGWLVNNLPSIFTMAKELIARIKRMFSLLTEFSQNLINTVFNFGQLLDSVYKNISSFDFFDTSGRVERSLEDLQNNFLTMEQQFSEGFGLFTTALNKGLISGEDAAPFGTDYTQTPGTPGTDGKLQPIHKQALDIISGPESGGSYEAMNQGTIGNDIVGSTLDSKTKIGKKLTDMTIGEILQRQQWLMNKSNPQVSNYGVYAAGRYQFIPNTLPGVMKSAGLTPQDKFSPENQDLMAVALLKERGIQPWTVGGSKYSANEIQIVEQARRTPLETVTKPPTSSVPAPNVSTTVIDEINVSGPSGGTPTVGLSGGRGEFEAPRTGRIHEGIDIGTSGAKGYYVSFKKSGKVVFAGVAGDYGNIVDIITSDGTCYRFAHLAKIMVRNGESYNGQTIGEIGNTGSSPDIHLHYEVRPGGPYGKAINPRPYLNLLSIGRKLSGQAGKPTQTTQTTQTVQATPASTKLSSINQNLISPPQESPRLASNVTYSQNEIKSSKSGQKIIIIDDVQQSSPQIIPSGGSQSPPIIVSQDSLNSFIKQKLFLDLAYT